jgi:hypothetical protein
VFSTVCKILAAKPRNPVQRRAKINDQSAYRRNCAQAAEKLRKSLS